MIKEGSTEMEMKRLESLKTEKKGSPFIKGQEFSSSTDVQVFMKILHGQRAKYLRMMDELSRGVALELEPLRIKEMQFELLYYFGLSLKDVMDLGNRTLLMQDATDEPTDEQVFMKRLRSQRAEYLRMIDAMSIVNFLETKELKPLRITEMKLKHELLLLAHQCGLSLKDVMDLVNRTLLKQDASDEIIKEGSADAEMEINRLESLKTEEKGSPLLLTASCTDVQVVMKRLHRQIAYLRMMNEKSRDIALETKELKPLRIAEMKLKHELLLLAHQFGLSLKDVMDLGNRTLLMQDAIDEDVSQTPLYCYDYMDKQEILLTSNNCFATKVEVYQQNAIRRSAISRKAIAGKQAQKKDTHVYDVSHFVHKFAAFNTIKDGPVMKGKYETVNMMTSQQHHNNNEKMEEVGSIEEVASYPRDAHSDNSCSHLDTNLPDLSNASLTFPVNDGTHVASSSELESAPQDSELTRALQASEGQRQRQDQETNRAQEVSLQQAERGAGGMEGAQDDLPYNTDSELKIEKETRRIKNKKKVVINTCDDETSKPDTQMRTSDEMILMHRKKLIEKEKRNNLPRQVEQMNKEVTKVRETENGKKYAVKWASHDAIGRREGRSARRTNGKKGRSKQEDCLQSRQRKKLCNMKRTKKSSETSVHKEKYKEQILKGSNSNSHIKNVKNNNKVEEVKSNERRDIYKSVQRTKMKGKGQGDEKNGGIQSSNYKREEMREKKTGDMANRRVRKRGEKKERENEGKKGDQVTEVLMD